MICSPTNAYPNNNCVDGNDYELKITFFGDYCMGADFFIYDYNTKEPQGTALYYERGDSTDGFYNGEEIDIRVNYPLPQNNEYVWRAKFYERVDPANGFYPSVLSSKGNIKENPITEFQVAENVNNVQTETFICVPDDLEITFPCYLYWEGHGRRVVINHSSSRGLIKINEPFDVAPEVGTTMYLSKVKIVSIDSVARETGLIPIGQGLNIDVGTHKKGRGDETRIPNTYIRIGDELYGITRYYTKTGLVGVDRAVDPATIPTGTPYQIYQCFVITPYYYFTTKAVPVVSPSMQYRNEVIKCTAEIQTAGNYPVKYFYWKIYKNGALINQSEKIYSGRLEYLFREIEMGNTYTGIVTVVTQDDVEVTSNAATCSIAIGADGISDLTAAISPNNNAVKLTWNNIVSPSGYIVLRRGENGRLKYLETIHKNTESYYDYTAGDIQGYEYSVVPISKFGTGQNPLADVDVLIDEYMDAYNRSLVVMKDVKRKGIDLGKTVYGNVDTANRQGITWTRENIDNFSSELESWGENPQDMLGKITTVYGKIGNVYQTEIGYTPIIQTSNGAVLLSASDISKYMAELIEGCTIDGIFQPGQIMIFDKTGADINCIRIKNIIADAGKTSAATLDAMEYTGNYGKVARVQSEMDDCMAEIITAINNNIQLRVWYATLSQEQKDNEIGFIEMLQEEIDDIAAESSAGVVYKTATVKIDTYFDDWSIYFLDEVPYERPSTTITDVRIYHEYMHGDKQFRVNRMWKVQLMPKIDDITHNILRDVNEPLRGKPAITYGNKDYISFPLEFTLGYTECPSEEFIGYDQRIFEQWKEDVTSGRPVMIKDSKGNVWFGAITAHTFNIGYDESAWQLYTIKIEFSQTRDMMKTRVLTD